MNEAGGNGANTGARFRTAFLLTLLILVVEVVGGVIAHSLALLADAGHVLTDIVALGLAWFATLQAQRPPDASRTYGYHRTGILAALANGAALIVIVIAIAYEAVARLRAPTHVSPGPMILAATVGIIVNLFIGLRFRGETANLNVRAAMLHVMGDVAASAGVIVAALVILRTGWSPADPSISLGIAVLIAIGAWNVLRETVDILMEGAPKGVDVVALRAEIGRLPGVDEVHDLHVWAIAGGMNALSAHVRVDENRSLGACDALLDELRELVASRYQITHTTIQLEGSGCIPAPGDVHCVSLGTNTASATRASSV